MPILVGARLLKPLGNPPPNSVKYFATLEVMEQAKDRTWLAKVTSALNQHWQNKNAAKRKQRVGGLGERPAITGSAVLNDPKHRHAADGIWRKELCPLRRGEFHAVVVAVKGGGAVARRSATPVRVRGSDGGATYTLLEETRGLFGDCRTRPAELGTTNWRGGVHGWRAAMV